MLYAMIPLVWLFASLLLRFDRERREEADRMLAQAEESYYQAVRWQQEHRFDPLG